MSTMENSDYKRSELPQTPKEWKKWKEEKRGQKRKWKEERLIAQLEKTMKAEAKSVKTDRKDDQSMEQNENGCPYSMSIALPGSILDNAQSPELRTYLAGQIARAAVIFNVQEIVIFDETGNISDTTEGNFSGIGKKGQANVQLARILQYLECPQYLRKDFFPKHKDLQYAGLLNPLDCPHHMSADEASPYREGVILDKPVKEGKGSYANVGLYREIQIDKNLQPGVRVTVKMEEEYQEKIENKKKVRGCVVSPSAPYKMSGIYWGYSVRLATSLSRVFTESPHSDGYDMLIGTSERGEPVDQFSMPSFKHMLVVFGGVKGLEYSLDADQDLHMEDPSLLFNHYLNVCPHQGSRTIRTEEAILVTLSALRPKIEGAHQHFVNS